MQIKLITKIIFLFVNLLLTTSLIAQLSTTLYPNDLVFERENAPAYITNNAPGGSIAFRTDGNPVIKMILDRRGYRHYYTPDAVSDSWMVSYDENQNRKWILNMMDRSANDAFRIWSEAVNAYVFSIQTSGDVEIEGNATVQGKLTILGADFSEQFEVVESERATIQSGMVVAVRKGGNGQVELSKEAYDKKVVGIVSGAGGIQTGMLMGQKGTLAYGDTPIAISGRVYVWTDATNAAIEEGDFLTSADKVGYAMKVKEYEKARGAIIGKALTALPKGEEGLVLVLVNLQ